MRRVSETSLAHSMNQLGQIISQLSCWRFTSVWDASSLLQSLSGFLTTPICRSSLSLGSLYAKPHGRSQLNPWTTGWTTLCFASMSTSSFSAAISFSSLQILCPLQKNATHLATSTSASFWFRLLSTWADWSTYTITWSESGRSVEFSRNKFSKQSLSSQCGSKRKSLSTTRTCREEKDSISHQLSKKKSRRMI